MKRFVARGSSLEGQGVLRVAAGKARTVDGGDRRRARGRFAPQGITRRRNDRGRLERAAPGCLREPPAECSPGNLYFRFSRS